MYNPSVAQSIEQLSFELTEGGPHQGVSARRVRGAAVSDGTYGLTSAQQKRYSHLQVVAAAPV